MVQVVWFKRDLRIHDHAALATAAANGPVVPLLVIEPDLWRRPDMSTRHFEFLRECVADLEMQLASIGLTLIVRTGDVVDVLAEIHDRLAVTALHSHMETGNAWTFDRDLRVARWCRDNAVRWHQPRQFGVVRPANDRDKWASRWEAFMGEPQIAPPAKPQMADIRATGHVPSPAQLGLDDLPCPLRQTGGRQEALALLDSFLTGRGKAYHKEMSSPLSAAKACSRLSPHLSFGTVSMREVVQAAYARRALLVDGSAAYRSGEIRAVDAFIARLHWHCHFIQKLEDEPEIEHRTFHPAFENARRDDSAETRRKLDAWTNGKTGWPFVDACMRSLHATGWINFRMRAMLVAVASYHLWLDWRQTGHVLARLFTDYEPGIHWSQMQMQSGTTAINTLRIYNPVKQSHDQDPQGIFIRKWVPELAALPDEYIHEPWRAPLGVQHEAGVRIGTDYPEPVVDHIVAAREARNRISLIRQTDGFRDNQVKVLERHGSRKGSGRGKNAFPRQDRMIKDTDQPLQLTLDL